MKNTQLIYQWLFNSSASVRILTPQALLQTLVGLPFY